MFDGFNELRRFEYISRIDFDSFIEKSINKKIQKKIDEEDNLKSKEVTLITSFSTVGNDEESGSQKVEDFNFSALTPSSQKLYALVDFLCDITTQGRDEDVFLIKSCYGKMMRLIDDGVDINLKSNSDFTPLLVSSLIGSVEIMESLIKKGANTKDCAFEQQTILHSAIASRNPFAALSAIATGDQVNRRNFYSEAALETAVMLPIFNESILEILLAEGADDESVNAALEVVTKYEKYKNPDAVKILTNHKTNKKYLEEGQYKIYLAVNKVAKILEMERSKALITAEQDLVNNYMEKSVSDLIELVKTSTDNQAANTAMTYIVNAISKISLLSLNDKNFFYKYEKSFNQLVNVAMELVAIGADVNCKNSVDGRSSIIHFLSLFDKQEMINNLLQNFGANIEAVSDTGSTILHFNVTNKDSKSFDDIVNLAPQLVNAQKKDGTSALHMVAESGFYNLARKLLDNNANPQLLDNNGNTPLHLAMKKGRVEIARILIEAGCDVNAVNKEGKTPIFYALQDVKNKEMKEFIAPIIAEIEAKEYQAKKLIVKEKAINDLPNKMTSLQRSAENKQFKTLLRKEDVVAMMSLINTANPETSITTTKGWTPLHIAAKSGQFEIVESLTEKGFSTNVMADGNLSVLHCAMLSGDISTMKAVLKQHSPNFQEVAKELKYAIESGNRQLVTNFIREEKVIHQFKSVTQKERDKFLEECSSLIKKLKSGNNAGNIKNDLKEFINFVKDDNDKKDDAKETKKLSRREREQLYKELRDEKAAQEAEYKKIKQERKIVRTNQGMVQDELKKLFEEKLEKKVHENQEDVQDELKKVFEERLEKKIHDNQEAVQNELKKVFEEKGIRYEKKLLNAKIFIPHEERMILEKEALIKEEKGQMEQFLKGNRNIKSIDDIPPFMRPIINNLLEKDHRVFLKGSAVYQRNNTERLPADLDMEVMVKGMNNWKNDEIKKFVQDEFGLDVSDEQIFRGNNNGVQAFSVNVKDNKRGLDLSFYDRNLKPQPELSWIVSKEKKVFFKKGEQARMVKPEGFSHYLRKNNIKFNPETDFLINGNARGLILRLCFLESIGHISKSEIHNNLANAIFPTNPTDLLFKELKMDKEDFIKSENKELKIKDSINNFLNSHKFDGKYRLQFLENLSDIASIHQNPGNNIHYTQHDYSPLIRIVVEEMRDEERKRSPSPIINGSYCISNLKKNFETKEQAFVR